MDVTEALERLQLTPGASPDEIRQAYRRLSGNHHPDRGGSAEDMVKLTEARDVALQAAGGNGALVSVDVVVDLVRRQTALLKRSEHRREQAAQGKVFQRSLVRRHTSRLNHRKRAAQFLTAGAGILTALGLVLRAVAVPPFNTPKSHTAVLIFGTLGLLTAGAGLIAGFLNLRVQAIAHLIEDASDMLADRPTCLELLHEIEAVGAIPMPWSPEELTDVVEAWVYRVGFEGGTVAALARRIGPRDFRSLFVSKCLQHGLLDERDIVIDGQGSIRYMRAIPDTDLHS
jgi:DnaJ domain